MVFLVLAVVAVAGCGVASGSSIEFKPAAAETPDGAPASDAPSSRNVCST